MRRGHDAAGDHDGSCAYLLIGAIALSVCLSSLILDVAEQCGRPCVSGPEAVPVDLLVALAATPDPRGCRGVRYRFVTVLAITVCVVLAPSESTIRRIPQAPKSQETAGQDNVATSTGRRHRTITDPTRGCPCGGSSAETDTTPRGR